MLYLNCIWQYFRFTTVQRIPECLPYPDQLELTFQGRFWQMMQNIFIIFFFSFFKIREIIVRDLIVSISSVKFLLSFFSAILTLWKRNYLFFLAIAPNSGQPYNRSVSLGSHKFGEQDAWQNQHPGWLVFHSEFLSYGDRESVYTRDGLEPHISAQD